MILDKIYISSTEPLATNVLWARPLEGGAFSLYAFISGKWGLLKLMDDNGTPYPGDDTSDDCYTKEEIDNKLADILGLDAEGIAELKALIEDDDALTGLLSEIARKANTVLLSDYIDSDDPLPTDCLYKRIVGGSGREFRYLLPKEVRYSGDSYLIFRIPDDTDESFAYIVFKREHRTTTMQYYYNASYNTSTDEVPAWVEDAFGYTRSEVNNLLNDKVDKVQGKGLSTNDYTTEEKTKLGDLPTATTLAQALGGKANTNDLASVATSGNYNDLNNKPTLDDLNKDSEVYALDNSNADYITAVNALITRGTEIPISHDIEGAKLRVYKRTYGGTETGNASTTPIEPPVSEIPYSDGTTFVAYQRGNYRYIGLKWNFFDNTDESYTNGNIEVTCEVAGVLKLYFLDCDMHEDAYFKKNGQTTNVKLKNGMLSFNVEAGDVLTVSPTYTNGYQWVGLLGMSITNKYPISRFRNDAGYLTEHQSLANYYTKTEVDSKIGNIETLLAAI